MRVDDPDEVAPAIERANEVDDRPVVIDFRVAAAEKVFPMVPAGKTNSELVVPDFQQDQPR
jgi:acetolactate synthase-1/2/3 large subunit